ncbi:MAG: PHP domain-containing protein [Chloroflexota bacterium]|nr:PHP domain-containing protein [Chloroflexota bacterium]
MKADLHVHTTASDGCRSPKEVIRLAVDLGLQVIAITDHDSVQGIDAALAAAKQFRSLKVIPGIEVSTDVSNGEVHILGYFLDHRDPYLAQRLRALRESRRIRAKRIIQKLASLGIIVSWERVLELTDGGSIGRPHIARVMVERGYSPSVREAFSSYIGRNGTAFVEREKLTPCEAVELVVRAHGLPVMAHPAEVEDLEKIISQLREVGMVGIEVHYGSYTPSMIKRLKDLAKKYELIPCGGSDYHGLDSIDRVPLGGVDIPEESLNRLFELAKGRVKSKRNY